jgi:hypothetical protein
MLKILFLLVSIVCFQPYSQSQAQSNNTKLHTFSKIDSTSEEILTGDTIQKHLIVTIDNIPKQKDWLEVFKIVVATVLGGLILWLFQYFTQTKQNRRQEFENRINNYLEHQHHILNDIKGSVKIFHLKEEFQGRQFFIISRKYIKILYKICYLKGQIGEGLILHATTDEILPATLLLFHSECPFRKQIDEDTFNINKDNELEISKHIYRFYFEYFKDYIGHYFRHLYNILNYIEQNEYRISKYEDPNFLAKMIQARMSAAELFMLFYNSIMPGFEKMYEKVNKYCLIENLLVEDLLNPIHKEFYNESEDCKMKTKEDLLK